MFKMRQARHAALSMVDFRPRFGLMIGAMLVALLTGNSTTAFGDGGPANAPASSPFPLQVRLQVPFAPSAFSAEGGEHLLYEIYVTNFQSETITLDHVEVLNADGENGATFANFSGRSLDNIAMAPGASMDMSNDVSPVRINSGETIVLFMAVTVPVGKSVPAKLVHRLVLEKGQVQGAVIGTHHDKVKTLAPPVGGEHWLAAGGPGNGRYNHHRRGIFIIDGTLSDSRRFAVDWKQVEHGASHRGEGHHDNDYYAYGQPVFAVADAIVVEARDGLPDNPPGHNEHFHPALPVTLDNVGGNTIVLDLGDGQFAHYDHLKPGSVLVKPGQRVRRGEAIARIGASGDAREPHLHFSVTTAVPMLVGEGLPYVIDRFRVTGGEGYATGVRAKESPLDGMVIDFGKRGAE